MWVDSALVTAAKRGSIVYRIVDSDLRKTGDLVILDGLDRLPSSTLASLRPLIEDRELRVQFEKKKIK